MLIRLAASLRGPLADLLARTREFTREEVDLAVRLHLAPGNWRPVVNRAAQGIAGRLAGRLRRGVEFSVTRAPVGS